jgi:iron complex outermembrane receptor protein
MSSQTHSSFFNIALRSGVAMVASAGLCLPAWSQNNQPEDDFIEEIIVFATKIAADVQEIPVAVTAITGDEIQNAGIKDVFDLQQNAPGLIVGQSQTSTTSNFSIRGIGTSSNNFGLESSVGLYVDGVYRSRQSSMINDLVDIEAVEVLRGPQGTLFGKNTPQGAINMRTVAPDTDDRNAFVELSAGEYGLLRLAAAGNFSLSDNTAVRATIFGSQRDGYVDDYNGESDVFNDRDRFGARVQLAYSNNDNFDMRIIADYAEIDEVCCVAVSRVDSIFANGYTNPASPVPGGLVPGSDFVLFGLGGTVFSANPWGPAEIGLATAVAQGLGLPGNGTIVGNTPFDEYTVAVNSRPRSTSEDSGLSVELNWDLANEMTVTSITAYRQFDTTDFIDADFTDSPLLNRVNNAQQSAITQELRLSGTFGDGDRGQFVTGFYYFDQQLDNQKETNGEFLLGPYINVVEPDLPLVVGGINSISAATGGLIPPAGTPFPTVSWADDNIQQDHQSWAVFGQVDFPIGDNFVLTLGARYTDEQKDMVGTFVQAAQGGPPDLDAITLVFCSADPVCGPAFGLPPFNPFDPATQATIQPFTVDGWGTYLFDPLAPRPDLNVSLKDDQTSGTAKLTWFASDSTMFYASYGEGYKSGGTNTDRINAAFNPVFGAESSETIELGMKADFPDANLRVNLAIYDTQVDGLQANSWTGTGFNLQNAGKADTSGWELETWWVPTDTLTFQAFWVRSDAKFEQFENGTCWDTWVFHTGMPDPNSGGDIDAERCPRTGGTLAYNPEDTFFFSFTKDFLIGNSSVLFIRGEYSYYSDILTDGDLDPFTELDAISLVNARIGMRWENAGSELALWGRNLTDERYYAGSFDAPIQSGRMNSYPAEPLTWGVTYRMDF